MKELDELEKNCSWLNNHIKIERIREWIDNRILHCTYETYPDEMEEELLYKFKDLSEDDINSILDEYKDELENDLLESLKNKINKL